MTDNAVGGRLARRTLELVDIPSVSRHEAEIGAYVAASVPAGPFRELFADGESFFYATGTGSGRPLVVLAGHLDTVPAQDNVPGRIDDGWVEGLGASDMKGGLAAFLGALDVLADRGVKPPDDLLLVVVPDEEVGGPISHGSMKRWGEGARALWVLEPGEHAGDGETLVAGRRGMFNWRLTVKGKAAHSGLHYWEGRSALAAAARWTVEAQALSRRDGGPTVNAGRMVAGDAGFVENLAKAYTLAGTDSQLNVVPDRAVVEGEARFLRPGEEPGLEARLRSLAEEIARDTGTEMALTREPTIPPVDPDGPHAALCHRAVALAAARGWTLEVERERGGISFPNFLPDPNRMPVLDGLGPIGGGMHTREEHVELRSLGRRMLLLADLLAEAG